MKKTTITISCSYILALLISPLLTAQENVLETIVVTAQKKEATIQDTAASITAVTGDQLVAGGVDDTQYLAYSVPGLQIQRDVISKVVIRGIGTENFTVGGDPGVAIHSDGVYVARSSAAIFDLYDVERIEVLRGPQGTLYGRNATGGVINLISKKPTDEFEAYTQFTYGNYEQVRVEGAVSGPITDSVRGRLSGLYHSRDGYTENIFPGADSRGVDELDDRDLYSVRGQLEFDLTPDLTLELSGDVYRDDSNPPAFKYISPQTLPWQLPTDQAITDLRTVSQGIELGVPGFPELDLSQPGQWDQSGASAKFTWNLDNGMTLTSQTSYRNIKFSWLNDGDGLDQYFVTYIQRDESDQISQEFQLSGTTGNVDWLAGLYYLNEDASGSSAIPFLPGVLGSIVFTGEAETDAFAVFGQGTLNVGDKWRFTAGVRFNYEQRSAEQFTSTFGATTNADLEDNFDAFTPKFGIDYIMDEDTLLYASVTRGFKSGGYDILFPGLDAPYGEEFIWSYEAGMKKTFLSGRVRLNVSGFYYDYTDLQVARVLTLATRVENAADATIYGAEVELSALVGTGLTIDAGVSYLNTEFDEFCTLDPRDTTRPLDTTNCAAGEVNLAGNELARSPEWSTNVAVQYETPEYDYGKFSIRGEWFFTDNQFFTQFNRGVLSQGAYHLLNASVTFTSKDGRYSISAWGKNLGDKTYFSNVFESGVSVNPVVAQAFVGAPRTYGVTLRANF